MNYASTVEKGIPLPPSQRSIRKKYPWELMEVGDSFKVELSPTHQNTESLQASMMSSARQWKELHGKPDYIFRSAKVDDGKAVRIWRIK